MSVPLRLSPCFCPKIHLEQMFFFLSESSFFPSFSLGGVTRADSAVKKEMRHRLRVKVDKENFVANTKKTFIKVKE